MNTIAIDLAGVVLRPLPSGALWWPQRRLLCVSDLHLGKAERMARNGGGLLPPFECDDTLERLEAEIAALAPRRVICLGDSFDDTEAALRIEAAHRDWLARLMAGREWVWIAGNHDPGHLALGGEASDAYAIGPLVFRHIAAAGAAPGEVSGHYHPKARVGGVRRPCFLTDGRRLILPAFGTYTGGLDVRAPALAGLMSPGARAVLTGPTLAVLPVPA